MPNFPAMGCFSPHFHLLANWPAAVVADAVVAVAAVAVAVLVVVLAVAVAKTMEK